MLRFFFFGKWNEYLKINYKNRLKIMVHDKIMMMIKSFLIWKICWLFYLLMEIYNVCLIWFDDQRKKTCVIHQFVILSGKLWQWFIKRYNWTTENDFSCFLVSWYLKHIKRIKFGNQSFFHCVCVCMSVLNWPVHSWI